MRRRGRTPAAHVFSAPADCATRGRMPWVRVTARDGVHAPDPFGLLKFDEIVDVPVDLAVRLCADGLAKPMPDQPLRRKPVQPMTR